jgi:biopolymer transport protein ExbD
MRFKRNLSIEKGGLDIAPLIDVIFLLLIFFMLTSSFILQPGIRVDLPKAVTSEVLQKDLLVITVTADNLVYVDERIAEKDEISSRVNLAAKGQMPILIRADKDADIGKVIEIWDLCRKMDIKQVNIATTQ